MGLIKNSVSLLIKKYFTVAVLRKVMTPCDDSRIKVKSSSI